MAIQLRLQDYQLADIRTIRDLEPRDLQAVAAQVGQLEKTPLQPVELRNALKAVLPEDEAVVDSIMRQMLQLYGLARQRGLSVDDILQAVLDAVKSSGSPWTKEELARWHLVQPHFSEICSLAAVRVVATALELSYEYANLLQQARLLTDIRPIFNRDATQIEGAVVSHTLRLRYDSTEGDHSLSIAMDEADVRQLAQQCDRALQKARVARDRMVQAAGIPTTISGEKRDESE